MTDELSNYYQCDALLKALLGHGCNELGIIILARDFRFSSSYMYVSVSFTYMEGDRALICYYCGTGDVVVTARDEIEMCTVTNARKVFIGMSGCILEL